MSDPLTFAWGRRTYIMGILNVTPDSFSNDGLYGNLDAVVARARLFEAAGADLLDMGGESTRPGSTPIDAAVERDRVVPAIEAVARAVSIPISIDTYKAEVAEAALAAGARMVNDVWALAADPRMGNLIAGADVPVVLMHNQRHSEYDDLLPDIIASLAASVQHARAYGIARERIILDPGIGFGKTAQQNLELINRLHELRCLGYPILLGTSRKRYIGRILHDAPPAERVEGTTAAVSIGIARGADIVRVHDVETMVKVVKVADALVRPASRATLLPSS